MPTTIFDIFKMSLDNNGLPLIHFLMDLGAIPKVMKCPRDHTLALRVEGHSFKWYCNNYYTIGKKKPSRCGYSKSLTHGTFFSHSHLSIAKICLFVSLWTDNVQLNIIGKHIDVTSNNTLVDWSSFCREVCYDAITTNMVPIGGEGQIVEIDESKFGKRKYNRGRAVDGQWVFGGIERSSGKCFLVAVENRTRETLVPIIKKYILPGTTIMSDCWKPYDVLGQEGYTHLRVNHSVEFVDASTGACTNKIESTWRAAKKHFPAGSGRRKHFFAGYLAKYVFFKKCKAENKDPVLEFFRYAGKLYDPLNPTIDPAQLEDSDTDEQDDGDEDEVLY